MSSIGSRQRAQDPVDGDVELAGDQHALHHRLQPQAQRATSAPSGTPISSTRQPAGAGSVRVISCMRARRGGPARGGRAVQGLAAGRRAPGSGDPGTRRRSGAEAAAGMSVLAVGSGVEAGRGAAAGPPAVGPGDRDYPIAVGPPTGSERAQGSRRVVRAFSTERSIRSSVVPKSASRVSTYSSTSARMRATSVAVWAPSSSARATAPR